ncbi:MAG TPA: PQQ-dependent sugar dehydrogenase [Terriglobales bacterium]|nr:PQQ-dependent sugar dehydrogenase [Terriglobales bacterium]
MYVRVSTFLLLLSLCVFTACGGSNNSSANNGNNPGTSNGGGANPGGSNTGGNNTGGGSNSGSGVAPATEAQLTIETVAQNLQEPWSLAFAPDGRLFFTEAPGRLRVVTNGNLQAEPVIDLTANNAGFQGGLTGMDLDRNFASNGYIYAHYCTTDNKCHLVRIVASGDSPTTGRLDKVLLDYPVAGFDHTGGRVKVGPDNLLYLSTGDHRQNASAQDPASWDGKILRLNLDGTPASNPFPQNPYVYALGLRDPQGLAFNAFGTLYATDHGPEANDEVDVITAGANFGWPTCIGSCNNPSFVDPAVNLSPNQPSMPPSGATFYSGSTIPGWNGTLLIAILGLDDNPSARHLHQIVFDSSGKVASQQALFVNKFGRLRDVVQGPDGFVYISTSNYKQSNLAAPDDDRILRVRPK